MWLRDPSKACRRSAVLLRDLQLCREPHPLVEGLSRHPIGPLDDLSERNAGPCGRSWAVQASAGNPLERSLGYFEPQAGDEPITVEMKQRSSVRILQFVGW